VLEATPSKYDRKITIFLYNIYSRMEGKLKTTKEVNEQMTQNSTRYTN